MEMTQLNYFHINTNLKNVSKYQWQILVHRILHQLPSTLPVIRENSKDVHHHYILLKLNV